MKIKIVLMLLVVCILSSCSVLGHNNETTSAVSRNFTIKQAFPDPYLAYAVAEAFNKTVNDMTSKDELASLSGTFGGIMNNLGDDNFDDSCRDLIGIGYLTGITEFDCYKNNVTELPSEIGKLKNLKILNLTKAYNLQKLPPEIGGLTNLQIISLGLTSVKSFPPEITSLTNLQELYLGASPLESLPDNIGKLTNLQILDIHSTNVKSLPDSICNLTNLQTLDLGYLGLKTLPDNLGNLSNLQCLNLFENDLQSLPVSMSKMKKLDHLNIYNNYNLSEGYKSFIPNKAWENPTDSE